MLITINDILNILNNFNLIHIKHRLRSTSVKIQVTLKREFLVKIFLMQLLNN